MRRPLICKIHRDLLLGPQNDSRSLKRLHDAWGTALRALFQHYTPLFIGYGGNDDTLMDLLESLQSSDIKGQMIWCYYEQARPSERIVDVVANLNGVLVPVPDFDLLMVLLGERMQINLLDEEISKRASKRTQRYRDRIQRLDTVTYPNVARALAATFERSGGWWAWHQKAQLERDPLRRDAVYKQGMQYCPKNGEIYAMYARDLSQRRDRVKAEELYRTALSVDSANAPVLSNFAVFLMGDNKQWDEAEEIIRRALEYDADNPDRICILADVLTLRGKLDEAEAHYKELIDSDERPANAFGNYACHLLARGRLEEAASMVEQAELSNEDVNQLAAELGLYRAILERLSGRDGRQAVNDLMQLLTTGFERLFWNFDAALDFVQSQLSAEDHALFSTLARAIVDERELPAAERLVRERKDPAKQAAQG
jgi:Tfp pilus assembly protein PilF